MSGRPGTRSGGTGPLRGISANLREDGAAEEAGRKADIMNLGRVIGNVWATRKLKNFEGAKFLIVQPVDDKRNSVGAPIVAVDTVGAGPGELIFFVTAREAIIAFKRDLEHLTPCDAAITGIVEKVGGETL